MYLIFLSIQATHILLLSGNDREDFVFDLIHSLLNVIIYIVSFFFPYHAANYSHSEHNRYHEKMNDAYLKINIHVKVEENMLLHSCQPGNGAFEVRVHGSPAQPPTPADRERFQKSAAKKYKEYFREASIVQGANILNNKKEEFDFLPSLVFINIPLSSAGYTAALFLGAFSVIISFI
jgi:hypothetical protein